VASDATDAAAAAAAATDDDGGGSAGLSGAGTERRGQLARLLADKRVGRATVIFDDECDASWNVHQHSLQRRLAPSNAGVQKQAFFASQCSFDPQFEYEHEVEAQQLERFPVCKVKTTATTRPPISSHSARCAQLTPTNAPRDMCAQCWVVEAERVLDSVIKEFRTESAYFKAVTRRRKAAAVGCGEGVEMASEAMTPEQLVASAEAFLRSCLLSGGGGGGGGIGSADQLVERLTVHFSHRKTRAISVRGTTLNVPLPITLTPLRADSVWFHELGTHFLRNAINEAQRGRRRRQGPRR
jgi:hypothetical protein